MTDSRLANRIYYFLSAFALAFVLIRVLTGNELAGDDEVWNKMRTSAQPLIELLMVFALLLVGYAKAKNVKSVQIRSLAVYGTVFGILIVVVVLMPEYADMPFGDQKVLTFVITAAVIVAYWIISYFWGKRHTAKEEEVPQEDDDKGERQ